MVRSEYKYCGENILGGRVCQDFFKIFSTGMFFKRGTENGKKTRTFLTKSGKNEQKAQK
jgi:hypothetical protein